MLRVDAPAIFRATSLLEAFTDDDAQRWGETLAADTDGITTAYHTFCAMTALAHLLVATVAELAGEDRPAVLAAHRQMLVTTLHNHDNGADGGGSTSSPPTPPGHDPSDQGGRSSGEGPTGRME